MPGGRACAANFGRIAGLVLATATILPAVAAFSGEPLTPATGFQITHEGRGLSLHDEMYVLPFTHADVYHGQKSELVFQISAKQALFGTRVYFAYTQISYWQAYYLHESSPFRETNYNPEFFYRFTPHPYGGGKMGADAGIEHESNGQRVPLSRSWNQVYAAPHYQQGGLLLRLKLRWRVPEKDKATPTSAEGDDNPDINDYLGHADLNLYYRWRSSHQAHLLVRGNPDTGRGYVSLVLSRPLPREQDAWLMIQMSHGYGESLLDYDRKVSRVGVGIMLAR